MQLLLKLPSYLSPIAILFIPISVVKSMTTLSIKIKLLPTNDQSISLLKTFTEFNSAANIAALRGFQSKIFSQFGIHKICYSELRSTTSLSSQLVIRAIAKASTCFSVTNRKCPTFRSHSSISYDDRIMSTNGDVVSITTVDGRQKIRMDIADYQRNQMTSASRRGQASLTYVNGEFFLLWTMQFADSPVLPASGVLGVDLGVSNIATDTTGEHFSGNEIESFRIRIQNRRNILQRVGTKSAKRRLKSISKKEANYRRTKNHQISRRIVDKAKALGLSIKVEDLTHIRSRTRFRKCQRATMSGWAFYQLTSFIQYKAALAGVLFEKVDPRNTSRTCSECGYCDRKNRKTQSVFYCLKCGHGENADFNAAKNIAKKAVVSTAMVAGDDGETVYSGLILN